MRVHMKKCLGVGLLLSSLLVFAGDTLGLEQSSRMPQRSSSRGTKEQLIGTWTRVLYEVGESHPMGCDAVGLLIYDPDGRMSLQIMRPDRSKFRSAGSKEGEYEVGSADETTSAFRGYIAYFGTYEVREKERFVIHHVEGSLFPNWVGRNPIEFFELSDDRLTFGLNPIRYIWRRIE